MVVQVWDQFLLDGWDAIYRVCLALLTINEKELRKRNFEQIMVFFKGLPRDVVAKYVLRAAAKQRIKGELLVLTPKPLLPLSNKSGDKNDIGNKESDPNRVFGESKSEVDVGDSKVDES